MLNLKLFSGVFVRIKDKNLHVECFKCATCGSSLKNQGYYNLNNKLYCDVHARLAAMNSPPPNANGLVPVTYPPWVWNNHKNARFCWWIRKQKLSVDNAGAFVSTIFMWVYVVKRWLSEWWSIWKNEHEKVKNVITENFCHVSQLEFGFWWRHFKRILMILLLINTFI